MNILFNKYLPKSFNFIVYNIAVYLTALTGLRLLFFYLFYESSQAIPSDVLLNAFYIGFKFDVRVVFIMHLPLILLSLFRSQNVFYRSLKSSLWVSYLMFIFVITSVFYISDFGYYAYLRNTRIDATSLSFLHNLHDSLEMIWESYHVVLYILSAVIFIILYGLFIKNRISRVQKLEVVPLGKKSRFCLTIVCSVLFLFGIYGKVSYYPLRWCDAFFSSYTFASVLAMNPILYFSDTLKNKDVKFDREYVSRNYDSMCDYLKIDKPDKQNLNFRREIAPREDKPKQFNVVFVLLESFAFYKTGLSENPLNPTPNFDAMAQKAILFTRYYVPHGGTARSVFTLLTGLPDVESNSTSTRNPLTVNQHMIINSFYGHDKFYFLGGSATWGNIRGLLTNNIPNLNLYEEGDYSHPKGDVWGISDLHLFEEANEVLRKKVDKPFVAVIHTAGNHKPYTIPDDKRGFELRNIDDREVQKYGFLCADDFNSFRFIDHSLGVFFEQASKEKYFKNTIFVFFGDHGLIRNAEHIVKGENVLGLTDYHVPLVIYAPGIMKEGKTIDKVASEVDVLPTLAGFVSVPYVNTTLGRDLFDPRFDESRYAFTIIHRKIHEIGLVSDRFYFVMNEDLTNKKLYDIYSPEPLNNLIDLQPEIAAKMQNHCKNIYETTKYIRYHNSDKSNTGK